jgi:hypothetical protein
VDNLVNLVVAGELDAAAGGRLYVSLLDGSVLCLGDRFAFRMD